MNPDDVFVSPLSTEIRASRPSGSLSVQSAFAAAKLTSGTVQRLPQGGDRALAFQIHQAGDHGQFDLQVFVIQHRFELRKIGLPRADQAERLNRVFPAVRIFVPQ
jgi:hypothetical protein